MQQYFINDTFKIGERYYLDDQQNHHLLHVLKAKDNLNIKVVDNNGNYDIVNFEVKDNKVSFIIKELKQNKTINKRILLMSLIKKDKWDYCLMKATELGVTDIYPLYLSRCVVKAKEEKLERYNKIVESAAAQCKREDIPVVHQTISIKEIPQFDGMTKIIPYEKEDSLHISKLDLKKDCVFVIGPEGGFTTQEVDYFINNGFTCVTLGSRILRAETAAFYTLAAIDIANQGE